jgi:hypothetical protein
MANRSGKMLKARNPRILGSKKRYPQRASRTFQWRVHAMKRPHMLVGPRATSTIFFS